MLFLMSIAPYMEVVIFCWKTKFSKHFFFLMFFKGYLFIYEFIYVCVLMFCHHTCLFTMYMPVEFIRRHQIPWQWSYRWFWVMIWILEPNQVLCKNNNCSKPLSHLSSNRQSNFINHEKNIGKDLCIHISTFI